MIANRLLEKMLTEIEENLVLLYELRGELPAEVPA
jgi:hypothetical protein